MTPPLILQTLSGVNASSTPIWMMRQAGRYLSEYREMRRRQKDFISFCLDPEKACEVTLQPISRFDFDAAIIFSDILMVPWALNRHVRFIPKIGPKLEPISPNTKLDIELLDEIDDRLAPVGKAIGMVRFKLAREKAVIGFAGAPWTVITYMIEGGSSRDFALSRQYLWSHTKEFEALLDYITEATIKFLFLQAKSGADVLMIFDSWANVVPAEKREEVVIAPVRRIVNALRDKKCQQPIIGFPKGIGEGIIAYANEAEVDALAIDQMTDPKWVDSILPKRMPVQGNLDPLSLLVGGSEMTQSIDYILDCFANRPHIFNLGHGITPPTPISSVEQMVQRVRGSDHGI